MAKPTELHTTIAMRVMAAKAWLTVLLALFFILLLLLPKQRALDQAPSLPFSYLIGMPAHISFNAQYQEQAAKHSSAPSSAKSSSKPHHSLASSSSPPLNTSAHVTSEHITVSLWTHLEPIFNHSDSIPEAKRGIMEARLAWAELLKEEGVEKSAYKSDEKKCPSSISAINFTSSEGVFIPCGLIVDSSITILGAPEGEEQEFAIELLGPMPPGEGDTPIVLHYNVRLQGDRVTEEAVIVQNSWTKDHGWGDEQRCPSHVNGPRIGFLGCNRAITFAYWDDSLHKLDGIIMTLLRI